MQLSCVKAACTIDTFATMENTEIVAVIIVLTLEIPVESLLLNAISTKAHPIGQKRRKNNKMSYDIQLLDPVTKEVIDLDAPHQIKGGTYAIGGTSEAWLNITYNYADRFYRVFGEKGIRIIYGMTGAESIPVIKAAMDKLSDDVSDDYWKSTDGNAKKSLAGLLAFAQMRPDGIWDGD